MSEPSIRIETLVTGTLVVERLLAVQAASDAAVDREPVRPAEIWNDVGAVAAIPPPLTVDGSTDGSVTRLKLRRPLAAIAGGPAGSARFTGDIVQTIPRSFDPVSNPLASVAPLLATPQQPATGYRPAIEDANGTVYVQDPAVWIVDFIQMVVEFPTGLPDDWEEPLSLTYFQYTGAIGGTGGGGGGTPVTIVPQSISTSAPAPINPLATLVQIDIDTPGTTSLTLPDGMTVGHEVAIVVVGDAGGGTVRITPSTFSSAYTSLDMSGVGFSARLAWTASPGWAGIGGTGAVGVM